MAKFNEKKTVKQPESVNFMGEKAFLLKPPNFSSTFFISHLFFNVSLRFYTKRKP